MQVPNNISDDCCDALVELMFCTIPSADPDELALLIGAILRIMGSEVRRAVRLERLKMSEPSVN